MIKKMDVIIYVFHTFISLFASQNSHAVAAILNNNKTRIAS